MILAQTASNPQRVRLLISGAGHHRLRPYGAKAIATSLRPVLIAALLFGAAGCAHRPSATDTAQWTYPEGPGWGEDCAAAPPPQQSPIDLTTVTTTPWTASTVVTQATFDSHDQNVVFQPSPGPSVSIVPGIGEKSRGFIYSVAAFHFHHRNEHVIAGRPVFEMHIKTKDQFGGAAVFAALWTPDPAAEEDATLAAVHQSLSAPPGSVTAVDVSRVLWTFGHQSFYSYIGSLTTPPCSPDIRWFVLQTPIRTAPAILERLKAVLVERGMPADNVRNPRPIAQPQPVIYLVKPGAN